MVWWAVARMPIIFHRKHFVINIAIAIIMVITIIIINVVTVVDVDVVLVVVVNTNITQISSKVYTTTTRASLRPFLMCLFMSSVSRI